jgi:hypothetical protein
MRIRDRGSECDLDIFRLRSWRDMTRFAGAWNGFSHNIDSREQGDIHKIVLGDTR